MAGSGPPVVTFYRMVDTAPEPGRADRWIRVSRDGRQDPAAAMAAGFGWHVFPPCDFDLFWDGTQAFWTAPGLEDWQVLDAATFPLAGHGRGVPAPQLPPLLAATRTPGLVRVWTGLAARSAPGWSLLVRSPANLPRQPGFETREGVVEADDWFGPLSVLIRLTRTDAAVRFRRDQPFLQVQPIPRLAYADRILGGVGLVGSIDAWAEADRRAYCTALPQERPRLAAAAD